MECWPYYRRMLFEELRKRLLLVKKKIFFVDDDPGLMLPVAFCLAALFLKFVAEKVGPIEDVPDPLLLVVIPVGLLAVAGALAFGTALLNSVFRALFPNRKVFTTIVGCFLFFALANGWNLGCSTSPTDDCVPGYVDTC